jgi:hypothetical protein
MRQGPRPGDSANRVGNPEYLKHVSRMREAVGLKPYPIEELPAAWGDEGPRRICDRVLILDSECIESRRDLVRVMKWLGTLTGAEGAGSGIKSSCFTR